MPPDGQFLIVCEGQSDEAFFRHLIQKRNLPQFKVVYPMHQQDGGWRGFAPRLRALKTEPGFDELRGILVAADNDDNPTSSFRNVCDQLRAAGYPVPERPLQAIRAPEYPALAVMMLPWADQGGKLESLCLV
jgi:hypothetical protein